MCRCHRAPDNDFAVKKWDDSHRFGWGGRKIDIGEVLVENGIILMSLDYLRDVLSVLVCYYAVYVSVFNVFLNILQLS